MAASTQRSPWVVLGFIWMMNLVLFTLIQCVSPLLPVLIDDFMVSHAAGGFLYTIPIMMVALLSYPLGLVSDRLGTTKTLGFGAAATILFSFLRPLSPNFAFLLLSTGLFGLGFSLYFPNLAKTVKHHFPPSLIGTATGIYTTAIPLGAGLGIALSKPLLTATQGWRVVMTLWSILALLVFAFCGLAVYSLDRRNNVMAKRRPCGYGTLTPDPTKALGNRGETPLGMGKRCFFHPVLLCGLLLLLLNFTFYATIGWLPTYLAEKGWLPVSAGGVTSVISFVEVPAVLIIPLICNRARKWKEIIIGCFLLIALSCFFLATLPSWTWVLAPVLGITFGGAFVLLLAFPAQFSRYEKVGQAAGGILSIGYMGALAGPPLAGYLRDVTGDFLVSFVVMTGAALVAVGVCFLLPDFQPLSRCGRP